MKTKLCNQCNEKKPLEAFSFKKTSSDKLRANCRKCRNIQTKNWRNTGKTQVSEFDNISLNSLNMRFESMKRAFYKHGILIYKRKTK